MNAKILSSLAVLSLVAAPTIALAKTSKTPAAAKVVKAPKKEKAHK